jgi:hypothetical protein
LTVSDLKPTFEYTVRVMGSVLNGEITAVDLALTTDSNGAGSLAVGLAMPISGCAVFLVSQQRRTF